MALILKDRVKETSTSTGTGNFVLDGAVDGFQSFTSALSDGDTTYYAIEDGTDWETGLGTWTESTSTLARTTVYESSNSNNAVNWGAGSKNVFITQPASRAATIAVYPTIDDLPLTENVQAGDQAYVSGNNRLYLFNGNGWYNIALVNETPSISGNEASYTLATDGTPTTVTMTGTDPEGIPITWSATTSGDTGAATVTNTDNVFTITPSTDTADAGVITVTFRASDGVNIGTANSEFTLVFLTPLWADAVLSIGTSSTNGLANSTFIDRSTNAHTVTPSGTPVQTAFHPYLDNWSFYTNRTGSTNGGHLRSDYSSALDTDDFSIECWMYYIAGADAGWTGNRNDTSGGFGSRISGTSITIGRASGAQYNQVMASSTIPDMTNRWAHIVICRTSGTTSIFVDGTRYGTSTSTFDWNLDNAWVVGFEYNNYTTATLEGYISNYRLVVGSSAYDATQSSIAVPIESLTAITNTKILTARSNRFIDESSNNVTFSIQNTPRISAFNPFGQESEYAVGENKGSTYFDGSSSVLDVSHDGTALDLREDPFTVECWVYAKDLSNDALIFSQSGNDDSGFAVWFGSSGELNVQYYVNNDNRVRYTINSVAKINTWYHVALVCDGDSNNTSRVYVNGTEIVDWTAVYNWGDDAHTADFSIGYYALSKYRSIDARVLNGYIADFRIVKGTALYTSAFTPPTAPLTDITNASLYLPMDNAGIFDKTGNNTLTLNGDVTTSTTQTKFADTSMYFDGTGDHITQSGSGQFAVGTGDFTAEFWYYEPTGTSGNRSIFETRSAAGATNGFLMQRYDTNLFRMFTNATIVSASLPAKDSWNHYALTRENGTVRLFINGVLEDSAANSQDFTNTTAIIGNNANFSQSMIGYLENFQFINGVAKYTTNFTVPDREQGITYQAES